MSVNLDAHLPNITWRDLAHILLKTVELKDTATYDHSLRVAALSLRLAMALGFKGKALADLEMAALFHDVGKIGIPENILKKPGKLTAQEYEIIKSHPEKSVQVLRVIPESASMCLMVLHHQERLDGRGYPRGLRGEEIPLGSRIIMVADAFDAMTSDRVYRKAMSPQVALHEIQRCSGSQFDSEIVKVF